MLRECSPFLKDVFCGRTSGRDGGGCVKAVLLSNKDSDPLLHSHRLEDQILSCSNLSIHIFP